MHIGYLPAVGQAYTVPFKFLFFMQPLENMEDPFFIGRVYAYAVIAYIKLVIPLGLIAAYPDFWRGIRLSEFDCIAYKVLEQ